MKSICEEKVKQVRILISEDEVEKSCQGLVYIHQIECQDSFPGDRSQRHVLIITARFTQVTTEKDNLQAYGLIESRQESD